jgi:hypothetical protein
VNEAETRAELIDPALRLPDEFAALAGERVLNRLRSLARLIGREPVMLMG